MSFASDKIPNIKASPHADVLLRDASMRLSKSTVWAETKNFYGGEPSEDVFLIVGYDTEFKSPKGLSRDDIAAGKAKYEVLSYQVYCKLVDPSRPDAPEWGGVFYPAKGSRLKFADLITFAVWKGVSSGKVNAVPRNILLVGHFTRADMPALFDFGELAQRFESVRNTFVTLKEIKLEYPFADAPVDLSVSLRDTMLLTAAGAKSLKAIGDLVGVPKITLSADPAEEQRLKENMDELLERDPDLFERYALNDAVICVRYIEQMISLCSELLGSPEVPVTLSGIGVKMLIEMWKSDDRVDADAVLGKERRPLQVYNKKTNRYYTKKVAVAIEEPHLYETLATECYHGGRGEQFWYGPGFVDNWTDYDLSGAYPTAMALIRTPAWKETRVCLEAEKYTAETLGVARVKFEFPESVRFPTMPVRTANGLVFPRKGVSYCAAPEIALARALGASVTVMDGVIVPYANDIRPFGEFIKDCVARRKSYPKGSLQNLFWKELSNSTYGKTAQGLREKRVFSLKHMDTIRLEPSRITNPFYAAYITSFVRAVLGEIMNALPPTVCVFSCTTDGFLSTATKDEMETATAGPLCTMFGKSREWLTGDFSVVEIKHECRRPLGWRTRGQATLLEGTSGEGDYDIVLAKGGIHAPWTHDTVRSQNDFILDLFFNRDPETEIEIRSMTGVRDIVEHDADLVEKVLTKRLGMEFDWKRRPLAAEEKSFRNHHHLAFSTTPWNSVTQFEAVRTYWDDFQGRDRMCLKTLPDFQQFAEYVQTRSSLSDSTYLRKQDPAIKRLRQMLCSAWHASTAGLDREAEGLTAQQFADELVAAGVPCKRSDVENGKKKPFEPHRCPPTVEVEIALQKLCRRFKCLDPKALLATADGQIDMTKALKAKCSFIERR